MSLMMAYYGALAKEKYFSHLLHCNVKDGKRDISCISRGVKLFLMSFFRVLVAACCVCTIKRKMTLITCSFMTCIKTLQQPPTKTSTSALNPKNPIFWWFFWGKRTLNTFNWINMHVFCASRISTRSQLTAEFGILKKYSFLKKLEAF